MKHLKVIIFCIIALIIIGYIFNYQRIQKHSATPMMITQRATINKNLINEQSQKINSIFFLGMPRQEVIDTLNEMQIEIMNEIEITSKEEAWDYGNKVILTEAFYFTLDKNNLLYAIVVQNKLSTALGLKIGSSLRDMENTYGKRYTLYRNSQTDVYEYVIKKHYFRVYIENGIIQLWEVSKYKFDKK